MGPRRATFVCKLSDPAAIAVPPPQSIPASLRRSAGWS
ncbi:hypothetical protein M2202_000661 [Bradyrhizobium japonicum]|nr:hypothetical protein [Bradyrhizobium japonicum]MCP1792736.1 hypothetical protein [Bradyrhizobium japonicum]MCP1805171.1 hypothetical protein [Bradyrhizobium japonicum]MCP1814188.1 hypothetical protein [Bradyrhizobium japonicum]MCP1874383.1 hypothetical protein [Bradyrhizobium japonicum]